MTSAAAVAARGERDAPWRWRVLARVSRLWRWEFWPQKLFYVPMVPVWCSLGLWHRSSTCWTAANPAMPHAGTAGERKSDVLAMLPRDVTPAFALIAAGPLKERVATLERAMSERAIGLPAIIKPDIGERGSGVRLVRTLEQAAAVMCEQPQDLIVQAFSPGPVEVGIAYVRHPTEATGKVFSITAKRFPTVIGDGQSTLRELIWRDARLRMQASTFLTRLADRAGEVPSALQVVTLAVAGNHCQGTMFLDAPHLITPALEREIDRIAQSVGDGRGFFIGRLDVRCASEAALMRGENLSVLEINGVVGESTNIYDPSRSIVAAYVTLARQWAHAFAIGKDCERLGLAKATPPVALVRAVLAHVNRPGVGTPSD